MKDPRELSFKIEYLGDEYANITYHPISCKFKKTNARLVDLSGVYPKTLEFIASTRGFRAHIKFEYSTREGIYVFGGPSDIVVYREYRQFAERVLRARKCL